MLRNSGYCVQMVRVNAAEYGVLARVMGGTFYVVRRMMRETLHAMDQSSLALLDARRLLAAAEDRDTFILTRVRVEPHSRWPRLQRASRRQCRQWRRAGDGSIIVWDDLDVRLSVRVRCDQEHETERY